MKLDVEKETVRAELMGSLLEFTRFFFRVTTSREFIISQPIGRESHFISIARELSSLFRMENKEQRLLINVPPGHAKSTMLSMWVAWCFAHYPDCRFMYISYGKNLASKHTEFIRRIMSTREYKYLFDVHIRVDSKAKDYFMTDKNGVVASFGSSSSIVGSDAGLPGLDRFSGAVICDDLHKVDEATSDLIRENVIRNYSETIMQRPRGKNVPIVFIGQRVHEADVADYMIQGKDGHNWKKIIIPAIDEAGNALYPEAFPLDMLRKRQETDIYTFSSQYQQDPQPAGGALFKPEWFPMLDEEPKMVQTFLTCDTAETSKAHNDATAFSFWGLYEVEEMGQKTGVMALHWIDAVEIRVEPRELKDEFLSFYQSCLRHKMPPLLAFIEKKSTGVTLVSVLQDIRGISVRAIERTRSSGSKSQRFLEIQPYIAAKLVSFTDGAKHANMCKQHMMKITANDTHRNDDLADTCADSIRLALIDKSLGTMDNVEDKNKYKLEAMRASTHRRINSRR